MTFQTLVKRGFTLLELIVVLLILGILAAIAIPVYSTVQQNSVNRSVLTTAQAIARNAQAIATSDPVAQGVVTEGILVRAAGESTAVYNANGNGSVTISQALNGTISAHAVICATNPVTIIEPGSTAVCANAPVTPPPPAPPVFPSSPDVQSYDAGTHVMTFAGTNSFSYYFLNYVGAGNGTNGANGEYALTFNGLRVGSTSSNGGWTLYGMAQAQDAATHTVDLDTMTWADGTYDLVISGNGMTATAGVQFTVSGGVIQ